MGAAAGPRSPWLLCCRPGPQEWSDPLFPGYFRDKWVLPSSALELFERGELNVRQVNREKQTPA